MPAKSDVFRIERLESRQLLTAATPLFPSENITNENPSTPISFAGSIWFTAGRLDGHTLYRSDGTRAGTVSTASTLPSLQTTYFHPYVGPVVAGSNMYLLTERSGGYYNLNVTDGTTAGTRVINTPAKIQQAGRAWATARGNKIYFSAGDASGQWRLWESDGTDAGTKPISPPAAGVYEVVLAGFNGSDVYYQQSFTNGGTSLVRLSGSTATTLASTSGAELQPLNATQSIFVGSSNNGPRLWVTDGTAAGTRPIDVANKYGGGLAVLNNVAYFVGQAANGGSGLYRTDGTRAGTYALVQGTSSTDNAGAGINTEFFAGRLYFAGYGQLRVINPDGTFETLNVNTSNGDFYIEGDRLWLTSLNSYVTADQPLLVRGADGNGIPSASANGRFLFIGPLSGSSTQLYAWDETSPQTGAVSGYLSSDINDNGTLDTGEPRLANTDVYVDLNANGNYDSGLEPKYTTAYNGFFEFFQVPAGSWTVAPVPVAGAIRPSGTQSVLISPGFSVYGLTVLASAHTRLAGLVFNDVNLNGQRDTGEAGLSGVKVFISADPNATQPASGDIAVTTNSNGQYLFPNLDGVHGYVCVQPPSDRYAVSPTNYSLDANIPAGTVGYFTGPTAAMRVPGNVRVSFNLDSNADGVVNASDGTSSTFQVLIHADLDQDGVIDANEPTSIATNNSLAFVPSGSQQLRVVPPQGWTTSLPGNVLTVDVRSNMTATPPAFTLLPVAVADAPLSGNLANDADFNGIPSAGDTPAALVQLWDDVDGDSLRDKDEAYTYSTANGNYVFSSLPPGSHRIMIARESGTLAGGVTNFSITTAGTPIIKDALLYPNARATRVSGTAYLDANSNGILDAADTPLRGIGVVNAGSSLWAGAVLTDASGRFTAYGTVGSHRPQLMTTTGYTQINGVAPVTLSVGQTADNFTLLIKPTSSFEPPLGVISGVVYQDLNFNGQRDSGETGLAGATITIDTNPDGFASPTEPNATSADDGSYVLPAVRQGLYNLVITLPTTAAYVSTTSNANTASVWLAAPDVSVDFGAAIGAPITGQIRDDHNQNGVVDSFDNLVQNVRVWADLNNNGQFDAATDPVSYTNSAGQYRISRVAPSQAVSIYADSLGTSTLLQSASAVAPAALPGTTRNLPLMLVTTRTAVIAGRVYYDANRSGTLDANELRGGQPLTLRNASTNAIVATQPTESGTFYATFSNLAPGTYRLSAEYSGVTLLENAGGVLITVGAGDVSSGSVFGYANPSVNFRGRVLMDTAHDGANATDVPLAGVRAFLDVNSSGVYDDGDFAGISGSDGYFDIRNVYIENRTPYAGDLIVENPSGTLLVSPYRMPVFVNPDINGGNVGDFVFATPTGTFADGYVYEDRNTNGVRDPGEPGLRNVQVGSGFTGPYYDTVLTDREGYFVYTPPYSPAYTATIRTNLANNWLSTDVPYGASKTVTFVNGRASVDFGFVPWRLGGYAFTDANGDGKFNVGESPIAGKRVWIDSNLNNAFDTGEPTAVSGADGFWSFTTVGGGSYHLMQDGAAGFVTASRNVTLGETQARGGLDLASRPDSVPPTNTPLIVSQVTVDDGSIQRSMVRRFSVTINGSVSAGGIGAGAFSLVQTSGTIAPYGLSLQSVTPVNGGTVITLVPSGNGMQSGSIGNGQYTLSIDGSRIVDAAGRPIDAANSGVMGSTKRATFFRLRSDADGNGAVNFNDFLVLQNAFGSTTGASNYLPGLDTDPNGVIDFNDFLNLQNDFNTSA